MATAKQKIAERRRANAAAVSNLSALGQGVKSIPRRVVNYIRGSTPSDVARDVGNVASSTFSALKEDPAGFIGDTIFFPFSAYRDFSDMRAAADRLRRQGRNAEAQKLEALAGASALGAIPVLGRVSGAAIRDAEKAVTKGALSAAGKRVARAAPKALPAPPKPLALPAPGPGLPPGALKPRGGQWWIDKEITGANLSPEEAARAGAQAMGIKTMRWVPDEPPVPPGNPEERLRQALTANFVPEKKGEGTAEQQWLERALTKYYKNEFGSPDDPLRSLAERGLHYDPEMSASDWQRTVDKYLIGDPIQDFVLPNNPKGGMPGAGSNMRGEILSEMPWLAKVPVTDKIYGIASGGLDLGHFTDEFYNALNPELSGLPSELAVRPESLGRMTFPQAVEHVGKINQYRAKEMQRAALAAQENPVTQVFKDYAEDNPKGLRWVEIAPPKSEGPTNYDVEEELRKALKYEGDTMGHCVGGYCPDVMSGRSRIFSLRDAKGEPHVTIETGYTTPPPEKAIEQAISEGYPERGLETGLRVAEIMQDPNFKKPVIVQIKGKQNRAPKDDYLPFVQDFVKSQEWSRIGDFGNTGLVRLPDGRYLTEQQAQEVLSGIGGDIGTLDARYLDRLGEDAWKKIAPNFEGFAIGGRVERDRCFCRHPMAAK